VPLPGTIFSQALGTLTPRFSFSWKDDIFFDACGGTGQRCNFPAGFFGQTAFWVLNGSLTWRSESERFDVSVWVHNFLDEEYKTQNFDISRGIGIIEDAYADPRMFGLTATFSF
jgi:outer membrane receptor protein involved in Fe transport